MFVALLATAIVGAVLHAPDGAAQAPAATTVVDVDAEGVDAEDALANARFDALASAVAARLGEKKASALAARLARSIYARLDDFVESAAVRSQSVADGVVHIGARVVVRTAALDAALRKHGFLHGDDGGSRSSDGGAPPDRPATKPAGSAPSALTPLRSIGTRLALLEDPAARAPEFTASDARSLEISRHEEDVVFHVRMRRPLIEGMHVTAELWFDCDANRRTGENGWDYRVRASVGSHYRPNAFSARPPSPSPMTLARASTLVIRRVQGPDGRSYDDFFNSDRLAPPELGRNSLRVRAPISAFVERGARYAAARVPYRALITSRCAEHPIVFRYSAAAFPRTIAVDGRTDDWAGGPAAVDVGDELHDSVAFLDIREVWADHDDSHLYLRVDFDAPGFGTPPGLHSGKGDDDVVAEDRLFVRVQPTGTAYMRPRTVVVTADDLHSSKGTSAAAGARSVEISVPRTAEQSQFRLSVWTQALRKDTVGRGEAPWQTLVLGQRR